MWETGRSVSAAAGRTAARKDVEGGMRMDWIKEASLTENMTGVALAENIAIAAVLVWFSIEDIRRRSVNVVQLSIAVALAAGYSVYCILLKAKDFDTYSFIAGAVLAAGLIVYCGLSRSIGAADVVTIIFLEIVKGVRFAAVSSLVACALAAVWMLGIMCAGKGKKAVPLIPYILAASLGVMVCG